MRKFIVKHWFGNYDVKGTGISRAAISNFTLMIMAIIVRVFVENQTIALPLMVIPLFILVFTTFIYLRKFPVKWHELDIKQKHYYGLVYTEHFPKYLWPVDFVENYEEWVKIDIKIQK